MIVDEDKEWINGVTKGLPHSRYDIQTYSAKGISSTIGGFRRNREFDLILVGSIFSGQKKTTILVQLKKMFPKAPVVILSSYPAIRIEQARECLWLGASGYEEKPYYLQGISEIIDNYCSSKTLVRTIEKNTV